MNSTKPFWLPDTQGFLAIAIITLIGGIVFVMLFHHTDMDQLSQGVLMTMIGVLVGALKDVYSYYFSSSVSSKAKDATIQSAVESIPPAKEVPNASLVH